MSQQQQELELNSIRHSADKRTRFHVNRVKSSEATKTPNGGEAVISMSEGDTTDDDDDNERSLLNSELDNKYDKSFR